MQVKSNSFKSINNFFKRHSSNENCGSLLLAFGFQLFSLKTTADGATTLFIGNTGFGWLAAILVQICLLYSSHRIVKIIARQYGSHKPNFVAPALIFLIAVCASVTFSAIGFYDFNGKAAENSTISLKEASAQAQQKIGEIESYQQRFAQQISSRIAAVSKLIQTRQSQIAATQTDKRARYTLELANLRRNAEMLENIFNRLSEVDAAKILNQAANKENAVSGDLSNAVFDARQKIVDASEKVVFDSELKKFVETYPVPSFSPTVNPPSNLKAAFWRDLSEMRESAVSSIGFGGAIDLLSVLCVFAVLPFGIWRVITLFVVDAIQAVKTSISDVKRAFTRLPAKFSTLRCVVIGVEESDIEFKMNFERPDETVTVGDLEVLRRNIVEKLNEEMNARVTVNFKTHADAELDAALPLFDQLDDKPLFAEVEQWSEFFGGNQPGDKHL